MDLSSFLWGALLGVIAALATGFLKKAGEDAYSWVKKKINPNSGETAPSHLVIHMNSDSLTGTTEGISGAESQPPVLERVSMVTLSEINTSLVDAPPLQRDRIAESYVGLRVEWDTEFIDGKLKDNGSVRLQLRIPDTSHQPTSVWCEVPAVEYRELGILPEKSKIRVSGEIEKVASYGVDLKCARLHIYGMRRGT